MTTGKAPPPFLGFFVFFGRGAFHGDSFYFVFNLVVIRNSNFPEELMFSLRSSIKDPGAYRRIINSTPPPSGEPRFDGLTTSYTSPIPFTSPIKTRVHSKTIPQELLRTSLFKVRPTLGLKVLLQPVAGSPVQ